MFLANRFDRRDELEAAARQCLHEARVFRGVAERGPQLADAVGEPAVEIDVGIVAPQARAQIVARHELPGVREQQAERARRLGLERNRPIAARQQAGAVVEFERAESVPHPAPL